MGLMDPISIHYPFIIKIKPFNGRFGISRIHVMIQAIYHFMI
uniref:Phospholipid-transporting ATPase n=1 Tax=Rhizophora mucronata TaxID=61149 RepID=A0A2P2PSJ1_RHIMU